mgnify:CR=1 FL=1
MLDTAVRRVATQAVVVGSSRPFTARTQPPQQTRPPHHGRVMHGARIWSHELTKQTVCQSNTLELQAVAPLAAVVCGALPRLGLGDIKAVAINERNALLQRGAPGMNNSCVLSVSKCPCASNTSPIIVLNKSVALAVETEFTAQQSCWTGMRKPSQQHKKSEQAVVRATVRRLHSIWEVQVSTQRQQPLPLKAKIADNVSLVLDIEPCCRIVPHKWWLP